MDSNQEPAIVPAQNNDEAKGTLPENATGTSVHHVNHAEAEPEPKIKIAWSTILAVFVRPIHEE